MTVKYWIYKSLRGSGIGMSREKGVIFDNLTNAEAYVKVRESLYPNAEYIIIKKTYGVDSQ